jgi:transposase-like protein
MYAHGMSTRDIQDHLEETFGMDVSPSTISQITEKIWPLVEAWQTRNLEPIYPFVFLDAIHLNLKRDGRIQNTAVYICLGISPSGHKDVLGHWVGDGAEGANFWLSVVTDLKNRGVQDIFIACVDGLTGFGEAIRAVFPGTQVQRCITHQIRNSLKYVGWKDKKELADDLKTIYQAPTEKAGKAELEKVADKWMHKYPLAIKSWQTNWAELSPFFQFTPEIRRIMYTTNGIESYNHSLRKMTKTKASFPTQESLEKVLYLAYRNAKKKWDKSISNWALIMNQLAIHFEGRFTV